jgi:hypothetical protein
MEKTTTHTIIQAHPGWYLAVLVEAGDATLEHEPIIAWEIERTEGPFRPGIRPGETYIYRAVIPITPETANADGTGNLWAIKRPDGKYIIQEDTTLDDEAAAVKHLTERLEQDRAIDARLKAKREAKAKEARHEQANTPGRRPDV